MSDPAKPSTSPLVVRQLLGSEKFIYTAVLFMLPITVFTAMGMMSIADWRHDSLWALGMLISGKTLQGVADRVGGPRAPEQPQTTAKALTVNVPANQNPTQVPAAAPPSGRARTRSSAR